MGGRRARLDAVGKGRGDEERARLLDDIVGKDRARRDDLREVEVFRA